MRGLKQSHLAELIRVSQSTVSKWESGAATPSAEQHCQIIEMLGAKPCAVAETWLARLIEASHERVHAICDVTHRLLVASPARYQEWHSDRGEMFGQPLLAGAPDDIIEAERRLILRSHELPLDQPLIVETAGQTGSRYQVLPGLVLWERLQLANGTWVRLVTSIDASRVPKRVVRV